MTLECSANEAENINVYKQIVAKTQRQHRLLTVHWDLTLRCNERCTHCYLDVLAPNAAAPGELTTAECFRIIDELADAGVLNLTFSGGEILVRRDFFDIAEYARSKRFSLRLFTNGILIKPEIADRIAALHPYAVEISIYSTRPQVHERITQVRNSLELSKRALQLLHERGVRTVFKTPLMHDNVYEFDELQTLAQELGAQFRYTVSITTKDSGALTPLQHRMTYDDMLWLFRKTVTPAPYIGRTVGLDQHACSITRNTLAIDSQGNVFPCVQTHILAGNLRQQSLNEIWTTSPVWTELGNLTFGELPTCRICELRSLCVRCHGLARLEDGDIRGPATTKCYEALATRQVLIEKGALPADYPIPAHLQEYAARQAPTNTLPAAFIPAEAIQTRANAS